MTSVRYSPEHFRAIKRHYLLQSYLRGETPFYQWGAGEEGKPWLREWEGRRPLAVVDITPRKVGRGLHGMRVIAPEDLPPPGTAFTVVAVRAPDARPEIRAWMTPRGYRELSDYLFLAQAGGCMAGFDAATLEIAAGNFSCPTTSIARSALQASSPA